MRGRGFAGKGRSEVRVASLRKNQKTGRGSLTRSPACIYRIRASRPHPENVSRVAYLHIAATPQPQGNRPKQLGFQEGVPSFCRPKNHQINGLV